MVLGSAKGRISQRLRGDIKGRSFLVGWLAALACLWPGLGLAQTAALEGRVTDPLGGTINGAVVTVTSPDGGGENNAHGR